MTHFKENNIGSLKINTCMGDTAARLESDLDRDLDSCRSNTLRGMDLILPRVHALSS